MLTCLRPRTSREDGNLEWRVGGLQAWACLTLVDLAIGYELSSEAAPRFPRRGRFLTSVQSRRTSLDVSPSS